MRWRTHGNPHFVLSMCDHEEFCSIEGCKGEYEAKGYCGKHYKRWWKYGDPLIMKQAENGSGHVNSDGYKIIHVNGKQFSEHRHVMEQKLGRPLKPNELVHHKDGNRSNNEEENLQVINGIGKHNGMHRTNWDFLTHRTCTGCGKRKTVKFFYRHKSGRQTGAYFSRCTRCKAEYQLNYRRKAL